MRPVHSLTLSGPFSKGDVIIMVQPAKVKTFCIFFWIFLTQAQILGKIYKNPDTGAESA
jgi:hypothetical protein